MVIQGVLSYDVYQLVRDMIENIFQSWNKLVRGWKKGSHYITTGLFISMLVKLLLMLFLLVVVLITQPPYQPFPVLTWSFLLVMFSPTGDYVCFRQCCFSIISILVFINTIRFLIFSVFICFLVILFCFFFSSNISVKL